MMPCGIERMAWESKYVVKALMRIQPFGVMGLFRESERTLIMNQTIDLDRCVLTDQLKLTKLNWGKLSRREKPERLPLR